MDEGVLEQHVTTRGVAIDLEAEALGGHDFAFYPLWPLLTAQVAFLGWVLPPTGAQAP